MPDALSELKSVVRKDAMIRRDALPADVRAQAAETIAARPFPIEIAPGAIVSGFFPLKTEINPIPLMRKLAAQGAQLALPVIDARGKPLIMRAFAFGDDLGVRPVGHPRANRQSTRSRARHPASCRCSPSTGGAIGSATARVTTT